jgi:hypothetical protein
MEKITIAISRDTAERIRNLGRYGDTMDTIVRRILDEYEKMGKEKILPEVFIGSALPLMISAFIFW